MKPFPLPLIVLFVSMLLAPAANAQNDAGEVAFANSGSAQAQPAFLHGLAQLHDFEYESARKDFQAAERLDPGFAMAYWGEAMTFNHPIWMQQDRAAALAALARLAPTPEGRLAKTPTQREKDYLHALDILYGDGPKKDRDLRYADAMADLSHRYPDDIDAAAFYALALLGTAEGVRDERIYMRAAAIVIPLFYKHPHHPGLAHYLIHSCDDPIHAALALPAAEAYSKIAPAAAHAQHMTSHIFLALGMWNLVIRANENAMSVVNRERAAAGKKPAYCGHYNYWLEYGYLETGQPAKAKVILDGCRAEASQAEAAARARNVANPDDAALNSYLEMQMRYLVDTADWNSGVANDTVPAGDAPFAQFDEAMERGFVAAERGNTAGARDSLGAMQSLLPKLTAVFDRNGTAPNDPERRVPGIEQKQLEALVLAKEGHADEAVAKAREAAEKENALPYAFGPPEPAMPSYELLGNLLLQQNHPRDAEAAFRQALLRAPNRTQSKRALELAAQKGDGNNSASR